MSAGFTLGMALGMMALGMICVIVKVPDGVANRFFILALIFIVLATHPVAP